MFLRTIRKAALFGHLNTALVHFIRLSLKITFEIQKIISHTPDSKKNQKRSKLFDTTNKVVKDKQKALFKKLKGNILLADSKD